MKTLYFGPRTDQNAVLPEGGLEPDTLSSIKPVVVLRTVILTEAIDRDDGSGEQPVEEGGDGNRVQDVASSQHEFDTVSEAMEFAKAQHQPDQNPVETKILEFRNRKWHVFRPGQLSEF